LKIFEKRFFQDLSAMNAKHFFAKQIPKKTKAMEQKEEPIRIDKWLWAARLFKTRSLAVDAIKGGKVKIDGNPIKPSREVKVGDVIQVQIEQLHKVVEVKTVIKNRVSAKQVPEVYNDLTPKEEYERIEFMNAYKAEWRDRGAGRPTKKERRMIERLKDEM
jgi:ribosome-associated heat shock protein Hsp15